MDLTSISPSGRGVGHPLLTWKLAAPICALLLALLVCRSTLGAGDILQVDTVWGPLPPSIEGGFYAPVSLLQWVGSNLIGTVGFSRVYVIGVVWLCAFGPMVVLRRERWWVWLVAGGFGALNPWVYERLADGQWTIVGAAGALFFCIAAWESLMRAPRVGAALGLAAAGALSTAFSPHMLPMVMVIIVVGAISARIWHDITKLKWTAVSLGVLCGALLYGVVYFFTGDNAESYARVQTFGSAGVNFFRSADDPMYGLLVNLISLQGYWAERAQRFVLVDAGVALWPVSTLVIVGFALSGAWLDRRRAWLLAVGIVGIAVSASTAIPGLSVIAGEAIRHLPILGALREPEKWSALWLVAVVILSAGAVARIPSAVKRAERVLGVLLAIVVAAAIVMPLGLGEVIWLPLSLAPSRYPADWIAASAFLRTHVSGDERVLILPWHLYEALPFTQNRIVENPAPVLFSGQLISSQDPEIPGESDVGSPGGVAGPALSPSQTDCGLAGAARISGASLVVVEPVLEGPNDLTALIRCGFVVLEGGQGRVSILGEAG